MQSKLPRHLLKIALVAGALVAFSACRTPKSPEERAARAQEVITDRLDLDQAQQAKLKAVADEILAAVKTARDENQADRDGIITALEGELDRDQLLGLWHKRRDAVDQRAPAVLDKLVEFHRSLNNEQKAQVAALARKLREHRRGW